MTITDTAPLPTESQLRAAGLDAAVAAYGPRFGGAELVPGLGYLAAEVFSAIMIVALYRAQTEAPRDELISNIVELAYDGIETEGAREQARCEARRFLAWVESFIA